ncbi:MAG: DNA mismatch repair endonuclease MutL [Clostridia bacterium]|nr:DNA mismatch repair endonuclease MutL [Clostridia bacterium]
MGKINILGFDVANLIAAGEVVDRPSSVVKELLENSIDAGATTVTVEIQRGGVAFIRISDNGCGMEPEDLPVAILRHATSKISKASDLGAIETLGFRGEALAAISSVSRIRIFSRPKDSEMGAILTAEGGEVLDITETGCAAGTTIVVEDLFFNVPARRKFLKKDNTEAAAVGAVVERIALSRPDISIKYICDGELKFVTTGDGKLYSSVYSVFGKEIASRSLEVNRYADGITVSGYVSEPDLFKSNRNMENFFVNGRYVKSKTAMAAVEQAFKTRIPQDKFPICVLNIDINPGLVDVNVHPAKLEIKFTNEKIIFDAVYYAVINALESAVIRPELNIAPRRTSVTDEMMEKKASQISPSAVPQMRPAPKTSSTVSASPIREAKSEVTSRTVETTPVSDTPRTRDSSFWIDGKEARRLLGAFVPADTRREKPEQIKISVAEETITEKAPVTTSANAVETPMGVTESTVKPIKQPEIIANDAKAIVENTRTEKSSIEIDPAEVPEYIILGEAYNCYVIVQLEDRLLFVDKHAAHERIIFDELCRKMKSEKISGQMLLVPLKLELLEIEGDAVTEHADKIKSLGYNFETVKSGNKVTLRVDQIPEMLSTTEASELLMNLSSRLCDVGAGLDAAAEEFFSARLFQASCKAAIKGGRVYDTAHIKWICDRLLVKPKDGGSVIRTCPHGRPVAFEVKRSSIDRQFARLV